MIEPKEKACKGTGKAISVKGCGIKTKWRKWGLCPDCLGSFLFGTDAGKMLMHKSVLPKAKTKVKRLQTAKDKEAKEKLQPKSYYEDILQKEINQIVKYLDAGHPCIATNTMNGKRNAGHYLGRNSHPTIRYHLENIWNQSEHSNKFKSGDTIRYQEGIVRLYGKEYLERLESLKSIKPLKLSIEQIKEFTYKARSIVKWLKLQDRQFTIEERLEYRKKFNFEIGIYK